MKRFELINFLIEKYGYTNYLEIGTANRSWCFNKINCESKTCVDPDPNAKADWIMTSDMFFEEIAKTDYKPFDIIFIDGMHEYKQVVNDIFNSLGIMKYGGAIIIHDCNPKSAKAAIPWGELQLDSSRDIKGIWNGDVYKAFIDFKHNLDKDKGELNSFVVNTDHGCGVIINKKLPIGGNKYPLEMESLNYNLFNKNRERLLELITVDEFKNYLNGK